MKIPSSILKLFPLLLFAIVLWITYEQRNTVFVLIQNTNSTWLVTGLVFYFLNYITRAIRLKLLVGNQQIPFLVWLRISSLHGFYSYFLPFRSGDISLPLLLKKFVALPLTSGFTTLLRARLLDMLSLGILLSCSIIFSNNRLDLKVTLLFFLASLVLLSAPFLFHLVLKKGWLVRSKWLTLFTSDFTQYPVNIKETSLSLLIWFWTGCTLFSATRALSIPIEFMDIWLLVAIQLPLQLFPIQGVANSGNHEVGWVTGFILLGITAEEGLKFALASHLILIIYVSMLGVCGFLLPGRTFHSLRRE